jgi:hypothetical protein
MPDDKPTDDVAGAAAADVETAEGGDAPPEPELAPEEIDEAPRAVAELAAACVRFVATRYGVALDFTPETLSLVDQYVKEARSEVAVRPDALELVQGAVGAYLGEVIRRAFGGSWFAQGDPSGWRVYLSRVFLSFNPIGMAREALLVEAQEGWHAHVEPDEGEREMLEKRLAALPPVEDDEYYAPTTRFDVVSIAYDALRASMQAHGLADVRFGREDYPR